MKQASEQTFLRELLGLLIAEFGSDKVRRELLAIAPESLGVKSIRTSRSHKEKREGPASRPTVRSTLEGLKANDPSRHRILNDFVVRLRERTVLPESEDLRHFAQLVGLKGLVARSRREMIPKLVLFLATLSQTQLSAAIAQASGISESSRKNAFSLLTDKLLREP
ncbi:MAG TPA: hypothetical protein VGJ26_11055 [Pirellulales bacterium]